MRLYETKSILLFLQSTEFRPFPKSSLFMRFSYLSFAADGGFFFSHKLDLELSLEQFNLSPLISKGKLTIIDLMF